MGLLSLLVSGCGKPPSARVSPKVDLAAEAKANLPGGIQGDGWHIPWRIADPKHPNGPPITVLIADAQHGSMASQDDDVVVRLRQVRAQIFQAGKPAALLEASEITTDQSTKVVIGSGGVTIHSLPGAAKAAHGNHKEGWLPPNTTITADKMTWDIHSSKLIALGHVHAIQRAPGSRFPTRETTSDRMEFDIETGEITQ
jgi:hypothetical protein